MRVQAKGHRRGSMRGRLKHPRKYLWEGEDQVEVNITLDSPHEKSLPGVGRLLVGLRACYRSSRILPSVERVTTRQGRNLPLFCRAVTAARWMPPQQGTSMRTTVRLLMSFWDRMAVSFSV